MKTQSNSTIQNTTYTDEQLVIVVKNQTTSSNTDETGTYVNEDRSCCWQLLTAVLFAPRRLQKHLSLSVTNQCTFFHWQQMQ